MPVKILVIAGSIRTGSFNARLAAAATKETCRCSTPTSLGFRSPTIRCRIYDGDSRSQVG